MLRGSPPRLSPGSDAHFERALGGVLSRPVRARDRHAPPSPRAKMHAGEIGAPGALDAQLFARKNAHEWRFRMASCTDGCPSLSLAIRKKKKKRPCRHIRCRGGSGAWRRFCRRLDSDLHKRQTPPISNLGGCVTRLETGETPSDRSGRGKNPIAAPCPRQAPRCSALALMSRFRNPPARSCV